MPYSVRTNPELTLYYSCVLHINDLVNNVIARGQWYELHLLGVIVGLLLCVGTLQCPHKAGLLGGTLHRM